MSMKKCIYPQVNKLMDAQGMNYSYIAYRIGMDIHTVAKKLRGEREIRLWEAIAMKQALKTEMPLEELFQGLEGKSA